MQTADESWPLAQAARLGQAVRELRAERSAQWLSDVTAELGLRVPRMVITRLELGERKYVALHEVSMLAAALGVSPGVLLTWRALPDGQVEALPGRCVDGWSMLRWLGGEPLAPFAEASRGLPVYARAAELVAACGERERLRVALLPSFVGGLGSLDDSLLAELRERLVEVQRRINTLGGV